MPIFAGRHRIRHALSIGAILAVSLLVSSAEAAAASQTRSISINPASVAISIKPGETQTHTFQLSDAGDTTDSVNIYVRPYSVVGTDYTPDFRQLPGTTNTAGWLQIENTSPVVNQHQSITIPYKLSVPSGTPPGGYYAVIFAQTKPGTGAGVKANNRVGTILYITVPGTVKTGGSVTSVGLPLFTVASHLPISLLVSNTGGVHFQATANFAVTNLYGKTVFSSSFKRYVLPQTQRKMSDTWDTPLVGLFSVSRQATVAGSVKPLPLQWVLVVHPIVLVAIAVVILLFLLPRFLSRRSPAHKPDVG